MGLGWGIRLGEIVFLLVVLIFKQLRKRQESPAPPPFATLNYTQVGKSFSEMQEKLTLDAYIAL